MENLIKKYNSALEALYKHVGFEKDWVVYPIDDCTKYFWSVDKNEIHYASSEKELLTQAGDYYKDDIYKQSFYNKWIYKGVKFTMIFCDSHVDGMKWFRVFDNEKRIN